LFFGYETGLPTREAISFLLSLERGLEEMKRGRLAQTAGSEAARRAHPPEFALEKFRKKIHQIFKYPKFFVYLLYNQKQKNMTLQPINPQELRSRLNVGTVQFAFKKLDGTLRTAIGTTCLEQVPLDNHPKGAGSSPKIIPFFDLQKGEWRSVSVGREIFIQE